MKEKVKGAEAPTAQSRLPEATRGFVQRAFADGVADRIDEEKESAKPEERERWDRQKWLLIRYVVEDELTLEDLKKFAGVNTKERARQIYLAALTTLWNASPLNIQHELSEKGVLVGKRPFKFGSEEARVKQIARQKGKTLPQETRARIGAAQVGRTFSQETKAKISAAKTGKICSQETRLKISEKIKDIKRSRK